MNTTQAIIDSFVAGFIFTFSVGILMWAKPQGMLPMLSSYYTKGAKMPNRNEISGFNGLLVSLYSFLAFLIVVNGVRVYHGIPVTFMNLFWHGYIVAMGMNIGDVIFLDILMINANRESWGSHFGIDPEKLRARNFFLHMTLPEHILMWPLVICPFIGLFFAFVVRFFL